MKVILVTPDFPPKCGGIGNLAYNYSMHSSHNIDILTEEGENTPPSTVGNQVFSVDSLSGMMGVKNCYSFLLNNIKKYDCVYFMHGHQAICGRGLKKPYFIHAHGNELFYSGILKSIYYNIILSSFKSANGVIANSNWTENRLVRQGISREKIKQISPGVPSHFGSYDGVNLREEKSIHKTKPILLSVSRLVERKGHDIVLEAIQDLEVEYFICGTGRLRPSLESLARELNISDKVHFEGYVPDDELGKYYSGADVFVLPSKFLKKKGRVEGFGIVYLEANSFGLPVIAGNTGGIPNAVCDGETGRLVSPNVVEVRQAIQTLTQDQELYEHISRNAAEWAGKHTWERIAPIMDDYLEERLNS